MPLGATVLFNQKFILVICERMIIDGIIFSGNGKLDWNRNLTSGNYHLLCPNNKVVSIDKYMDCHLAKVPAHAVVTRPDKRTEVVELLKKEQVNTNFPCLTI